MLTPCDERNIYNWSEPYVMHLRLVSAKGLVSVVLLFSLSSFGFKYAL